MWRGFGEETFYSARRANCSGMGVGAPIEICFMAFRRFGHVLLDLGHTLLDAKHEVGRRCYDMWPMWYLWLTVLFYGGFEVSLRGKGRL